jgi:hypothetical protein
MTDSVRRPQSSGRYPLSACPHSHSIINEPSKLLIRKAPAASSQTFAAILAVNLSGTSIGARLRAALRKLTFRNLSRTIDSWVARKRFAGAAT